MFTLFGFPVRINFGFVVFAAILLTLNPTAFGVWLVGALAVFTLIHELGHAAVARHYGANAEISLSFMAGYTSYRAGTKPIQPAQRAAISLAGPAVQILVGVVAWLAISTIMAAAGPAQIAIWWAGPVIGLLNLIPVLPLDGGHLIQNLLTSLIGKDITRPMVYFSLAVTIAALVYMNVTGQRNFSIFVAFLLITQFQILQATSGTPVTPAKF